MIAPTTTDRLTKHDMIEFCGHHLSALSWARKRHFTSKGGVSAEHRYVRSLVRRALVLRWSPAKIELLVHTWLSLHSLPSDLISSLPACTEEAHVYADLALASQDAAGAEKLLQRSLLPRARILEFARQDPSREFSPEWLVEALSLSEATAQQTPIRMVADGQLEKVSRGWYRLAPTKVIKVDVDELQVVPPTLVELDRQIRVLEGRWAEIREHNENNTIKDPVAFKKIMDEMELYERAAGLPITPRWKPARRKSLRRVWDDLMYALMDRDELQHPGWFTAPDTDTNSDPDADPIPF